MFQWERRDENVERKKSPSEKIEEEEYVKNPHIMAIHVHAHEYTKRTAVRLVDERTGEEKRTIMLDRNFVFEFQGTHALKDPIEIPPHHGLQVSF